MNNTVNLAISDISNTRYLARQGSFSKATLSELSFFDFLSSLPIQTFCQSDSVARHKVIALCLAMEFELRDKVAPLLILNNTTPCSIMHFSKLLSAIYNDANKSFVFNEGRYFYDEEIKNALFTLSNHRNRAVHDVYDEDDFLELNGSLIETNLYIDTLNALAKL